MPDEIYERAARGVRRRASWASCWASSSPSTPGTGSASGTGLQPERGAHDARAARRAAMDHAGDDRGPDGPAGAILRCPAPGAIADGRLARGATPGRRSSSRAAAPPSMARWPIAEQLADALRAAGMRLFASRRARRSMPPSTRAPAGICIGVSHEGTTRATVLALEAARAAGAATASIGAQRESPLAPRRRSRAHDAARRRLVVPHRGLCELHPGRRRHRPGDHGQRDAMPAPRSRRRWPCASRSTHSPSTIHGTSRILTVGLGADLVTARELALKIEEGARIPSTALHLESLLHGHLAGCDADRTALVLFAADSRGGARRDWRLTCAAGAAARDRHRDDRDRRGDGALRAARRPSRRLAVPPAPERRRGRARPAHGRALPAAAHALAGAPRGRATPISSAASSAPYREAAAVAENRTDW